MINIEGHEFTSISMSRGAIVTHHASCACGVKYNDWATREAEHEQHVLAEVWSAGRESLAWDMARPIGEDGMRPGTPNPFVREPGS